MEVEMIPEKGCFVLGILHMDHFDASIIHHAITFFTKSYAVVGIFQAFTTDETFIVLKYTSAIKEAVRRNAGNTGAYACPAPRSSGRSARRCGEDPVLCRSRS